MQKLLILIAITVLFSGTAFGLNYPQAHANALNCVELLKFSAELSSPSMNDFMVQPENKKIINDINGSIYIVDKSLGNIKFRYLDINKKAISGKKLPDLYANAFKNAAFVEVEMENKLLYSAKLLLTYENPAEKNQNIFIEGTIMVKSGKDEVFYKIIEKVLVKQITLESTSLAGGLLKSDGKFKDIITIDLSKNVLNAASDKTKPIIAFNTQKRSQRIYNLKAILAR